MAAKKRVLVAGGMGVVGRAAVQHFSSLDDCEVVGLSRRKPDFETTAKFAPVDLRDAKQSAADIAALGPFTHVVYAALYEKPQIVKGWSEADQIETNLAMLVNLVEAVEKCSPNFEHITLMQGGKAYGVHHGVPRLMPAKESHGRFMPPNFYYNQEDWLTERQKKAGWSWTVLRPPAVCGTGIGSPMNLVVTIGVFCTICRELGLPLRYPGGEPSIYEVCDARIVAKAIAWAATSPNARNRIFNVANGDHFQWPYIWPLFGEIFKMDVQPPHMVSLHSVMADKGPVWDRTVKKHGLKPYRYEEMVPAWDMADFSFRYGRGPNPMLMSTIKIRQAGFHECVDSEAMFAEQLGELQDRKILPRYN